MQKFKNGDEVLIDGQEAVVLYGPDPQGFYCIKYPTGSLRIEAAEYLKLKPATINIRGVEAPKPLTKEDADDCRVTATPLTLFFRSYEDAARFDNALNGIKEGCDDE